MNIKQKLMTAAAAGSMLVSVASVPAFAADNDITVDGQGAFSVNKAKIISKNYSTVLQNNQTAVGTSVNSKAKTGNNKSKFNVGGTSTVTTGTATSTVRTTVNGGGNENTTPCECLGGGLNTISLTGGGAFSYNSAKIVDINSSFVSQTNVMVVETSVDSKASTGGNSSSFNVGGGSSIDTGDASSTVNTTVTGGGNVNN